MLSIHNKINTKLDYFIEKQKIPNIIFHGPPGAGKRTLTLSFIGKIYNNDKNMIYIVTSEFHKKRANTILNGIIPNNNFKWILSKKKCNYCDHNEEIHSKNIKKDIKMGLQKYNQVK